MDMIFFFFNLLKDAELSAVNLTTNQICYSSRCCSQRIVTRAKRTAFSHQLLATFSVTAKQRCASRVGMCL